MGHLETGRALRIAALTGVLILAFVLRLPFTGAGLPYLHHWNEAESANTALKMLRTGDLNQHIFSYGSLPIYLNLGVDVLNYFRLMGKSVEESHLESLDDIQASMASKERWSVSHPSFYQANRLLSVVFGVATVLTVYFLGATLAGPAVGLIAAFWLAVEPFHIENSTRTTPDGLVTLLTLSMVLFSMRFVHRDRLADLATAFALAGLAGATKYNAAVMLVLPVALLAWTALTKPSRISPWQGALMLLLPGLTFLAAMPYALLDLPSFLRGAGGEVRHYKVLGHGPMTIEPGWEQIRFQTIHFWRNLGPLAFILGLAGAASAWRKKPFLWLLLAPAVYCLFMIQMRANFHRNFLALYPYLAIAIALGIVLVHKIAQERANGRWQIRWLGVALGALVLILPAWRSISAAQTAKRQLETRTETVLRINELRDSGFAQAVIAAELKIHPHDLKKLEVPYRLVPTNKMRALIDSSPGTVFAIPEDLEYSEEYKTAGMVRLDEIHHRFKASIPAERILARIGGEASRSAHHTGDPPFPLPGATRLDFYSVNPIVLLVSGDSAGKPRVPS